MNNRVRLAALRVAACGMATWAATATAPALGHAQPADAGQQGVSRDVGSSSEVSDNAVGETDIIVTAQRRAERTQDVPISITSIGAEAIEQANLQQLGDISKISPATRFDYNSNFVQPTIRGIGTAVVVSGGGANVGIYADGFYSPNPLAADFQLLNVDSIQVLKGPQGTLFGRNTTGGAILVTTAKPSDELKAIIDLSYGRFDTMRSQAYVSSPLSDRISFDVEGSYARSNGYVRNLAPNGDQDVGGYRNWSVRAGLRFDVADGVSFLARYQHQSVDDSSNVATGVLVQDGVTYAGSNVRPPNLPADQFPDRYREVSLIEPVNFNFNGDVYQLTGEFDLGFADLVSYTQHRNEKSSTYSDQDQTPLRIVSIIIPIIDKTFTQEVLLTSKPGGRLSWTAGAFYFNYKDTFDDVAVSLLGSPFFTFAASSSRTESMAVYADFTYELIDHLFLTAGARYSHDKFKDARQFQIGVGTTFPPALTNDRVTPRAVLRYELSDKASIYGSFTKGYKSALIDLARSTGPAEVKPESLNAFEVGFKYAERELSINLASWYYDYKGLQVSSYIADQTGSQGALGRIDNAASARIYGVEGDVRYQLAPAFTLTAGGAYVNAKYKRFTDSNRFVFDGAGFLVPQIPFDSSGLQMQRAPKFTGSVGARYTTDLAGGRLGLSGNLYYTSRVYFDAAEQFRQDGYELVGLRIDWTDPSDHLTLAAYGDNVTGSKYKKQYNTGGFAAGWGAPTTWGVSLRYNFGN